MGPVDRSSGHQQALVMPSGRMMRFCRGRLSLGSLFSRRHGKSFQSAPYYRVPDFLPVQEAQQVLQQLLEQRHNFCIMSGQRNFLRLPRPLEIQRVFFNRIRAVLPDIQERLAIDLEHSEVELYVHAYNDGMHFDRHSDAHGGGNWRRRLSCVYYLHCLPRRFEGGQLVIYEGRKQAYAVEPEHNSMVFFRSHLIHEVLPVTCHSRAFVDSRFAINVWIL